MSVCKSALVFITLFLIVNLTQCTEFVPVFMWSTSKTNEKVPALHKISQDSFKDDVLEHLKEDPFVIVFAEQTLSPEDFAQHDQSGGLVFPHLAKLRKASKVSYLPYVQNPIKTLKHLDEEVTELSIATLKDSLKLPKSNILIVDLNDAKDDERRLDMLKRHDADIISIYGEITKKHDNVLALYTAHHTSWVAPEVIVSSRKIRSLLAVRAQEFFTTNHTFVYLTNATVLKENNGTEVEFTFEDTIDVNVTEIILTGTSANLSVRFFFTNKTSPGYWELYNITATFNGFEYNVTSPTPIYAPSTFSYHCGDQVLTGTSTRNSSANVKDTFELVLTNFQVQVFYDGILNQTKFSDAYDCVGFTSVPIWSGIFVTSILLLIMTFGITMMMDIRTMDRFDDAKGKTITINAE